MNIGNQKKYGLSYERKRKKELEAQGYFTFRSRGSFSGFDIIAMNKEHLLLESIKSTKQDSYSYKKEIEKLNSFDNCPKGTIKRLTLYQRGKEKVLWENTR